MSAPKEDPPRPVYESVISAVTALDCLAAYVPDPSGGMLRFATKRLSYGWTGNVFWMAERNGKWLIGTFGVVAYELGPGADPVLAAITWIKSGPDHTPYDLTAEFKTAFGLTDVTDAWIEERESA